MAMDTLTTRRAREPDSLVEQKKPGGNKSRRAVEEVQ
jgi:hypothetical protein